MADPNLVGTITKLSDTNWVGHRTVAFGNPEDTFNANSYPECKRLIEECLGIRLIEQWVEADGAPTIIYLRTRAEPVCPDITGGSSIPNLTILGTNLDSFDTMTVSTIPASTSTYTQTEVINDLGGVVTPTSITVTNTWGIISIVTLANDVCSSSRNYLAPEE